MFAMQSNPYLNTPLHWAKGIKKLILIQAVFDVLDGELPRDFAAGGSLCPWQWTEYIHLGLSRVGLVHVRICMRLLILQPLHGYYRKAPKVKTSGLN